MAVNETIETNKANEPFDSASLPQLINVAPNADRFAELGDAEFLLLPPGAKFEQSIANFDSDGVRVERQRLSAVETSAQIRAGHVLVLHLSEPTMLEWSERGVWRERLMTPGDISIGAAHTFDKRRMTESAEVLRVNLAPAFVERALEDVVYPDRIEIVGQHGGRDREIERIARKLLAETETPKIGSRLYIESLANQLAVRLVRDHSTVTRLSDEPRRANRLPPHRLRLATEFIEANLVEETLSLDDIARAAGVSVYYFARMFKAATGFAPHQYVLRRRIERAKELLAVTRLPVIEIAARVGFRSQSHFAAVFRRLTGVTPREFRQLK